MALLRLRSLNTSARILVAVKNVRARQEIHGLLRLLFSKFIEREDHVSFLHVTQNSDDLEKKRIMTSIDIAICEALLDRKMHAAKVTISSVVIESNEVCDGIIQEAKRIKATMVVLGSSQRQLISRSMHGFGKKCVKSLPPYCSILVVREGKVMHVKSGCADWKYRYTLKTLIRREKKLEQKNQFSRALSSSSCSLETILSFSSTDRSFELTDSSSSESSSPSSVLDDYIPPTKSVREFSLKELLLATKNFATENLVGSGGCSRVYKGVLQDGTIVAVKRLLDSSSGQREFSREIKFISCICHRNLVSLVGHCSNESQRLLVYNFQPNGSLQLHLYGNGKILSWKQRQKIALDAARGLRHLHCLEPHHVIHHDMKSSNILLSEEFEAQISDFGFARWSNELTTASGLVGTFGYMAPEYLVHGYGNEKTDVHAFGVVLLELISGRAPIDSSLPPKQQSLVHWARHLEKTGATHQIVDPKLAFIDSHEMRRMMYTAFLCIHNLPEERPSMDRVVNLLNTKVTCSEPLLSKCSER